MPRNSEAVLCGVARLELIMQCIQKVTSDEVIISFANQEGKKRNVGRIKKVNKALTFLKSTDKDFSFPFLKKCEWQLVEFNEEDFFKFKAPHASTWQQLLGSDLLIGNASRDNLNMGEHKNLIDLEQYFSNWFLEFKPIVVENGIYYTLLDGTSRSFVYIYKIKEGFFFENFKGYLGKWKSVNKSEFS